MSYNISVEKDLMEFKTLILKKHSMFFQQTIPVEMLQNMRIESMIDPLTQNLLVKFETYLASTEKTETINGQEINEPTQVKTKEIQYPETWWDAFKLKYFSKWLLAKYPVKYTIFKYDCEINKCTKVINKVVTTKLCPHIKMENENKCIQFLN